MHYHIFSFAETKAKVWYIFSSLSCRLPCGSWNVVYTVWNNPKTFRTGKLKPPEKMFDTIFEVICTFYVNYFMFLRAVLSLQPSLTRKTHMVWRCIVCYGLRCYSFRDDSSTESIYMLKTAGQVLFSNVASSDNAVIGNWWNHNNFELNIHRTILRKLLLANAISQVDHNRNSVTHTGKMFIQQKCSTNCRQMQ